MVRMWLAVLALLGSPATATAPAVRGQVQLPTPPAPLPADDYTDLRAITWTDGRCTVTQIGPTIVTATHCLNGATGWQTDGDIAWQGPPVDWVTASRGATLYGIGYPAATGRTPVAYALAALDPRTVTIGNTQQTVLMALGDGTPCTAGASGMVAWATVNDVRRPVGVMSVYSTNPDVTSLPAGQYVCGFAIT